MRTMAHASFLPQDYANRLIRDGAITQLAALIEPLSELPTIFTDNGPKSATTLLRRALEASESLCKRSTEFDLVNEMILMLVPILRRIILEINPGLFSRMCTNACFTLFHILRRLTEDQIQEHVNINAELCQRLILLMQRRNENLVRAVHLIVLNLSFSSQAFVQVFINNGVIPALNHNLTHQRPMCQAQACKTIYAMIYNNRPRIQQMLFDENLIDPIVHIIQDEGINAEDEAKMEAISVLSRAVIEGEPVPIEFMVSIHGCIEFLCDYLYMTVTRGECILALGEIIRTGTNNGEVGVYAAEVAQFGGEIMPTLTNDEEEVVTQIAGMDGS